jgi:L-rhamnose isomerase
MTYTTAKEQYAQIGVDTEAALKRLATVPISVHCWQGDDVGGFENQGDSLGGGLAVTGNYPGKARTPDQLRADAAKAFSLIPSKHRFNIHAIYAETAGKKVDRDAIAPEHFFNWRDWAKSLGIGIDFNPSYFSHPLAATGFTLTHRDPAVRQFWIQHGKQTRAIAKMFGQSLGSSCVNNVWIPDGFKDTPVDRKSPRDLLERSLDELFAESIDGKLVLDAIEGKLFGIGSESCVIGSHEFYLGYAITRKKLVCLDAGHYHPTESMADKISSVMRFVPEILLHVSRGVRWDSDHVVTLDDPLLSIARELVAYDYLPRTHVGLDYFDASINRVAAWAVGVRNMQKALLIAMLEPVEQLTQLEAAGDFTARLLMQEELKAMPWGAVWSEFCTRHNVPATAQVLLNEVRAYEKNVQSKR